MNTMCKKQLNCWGTQAGKNRDSDPVFEKVENTLLTDLELSLLIYKNNEDTYRRDVAENIAEQLLSCGILINIEEVSFDVYVNKLESLDFDLALCSFYLNNDPDPSFMIETGGSSNFGGYSDVVMDQLLGLCKTASTDEEMSAAYLEMENYFVEQVPHIGLYFRTHSIIYDSTINIDTDLRDLSVYTQIPNWYIYTEEG